MNRSLETFTTPEETTLHGQLSTLQMNDLKWNLYQHPTSGIADINEQGVFSYTPNEGFSGTDQFIVESIGLNASYLITVLIHVIKVLDEEEFQETSVITSESTSIKGCLVGSSQKSKSYRFSLASSPRNGYVILSDDGSYVYTPKERYCGQDSFTVFVTDDSKMTEEVHVQVTIAAGCTQMQTPIQANASEHPSMFMPAQPTNNTTIYSNPITVNSHVTVTEDGVPVRGTVRSRHRRGLHRLYQLLTPPSHGTVRIMKNGNFQYDPTPGYIGKDSFTVIISDRLGNSLIAPMAIEVREVEEE